MKNELKKYFLDFVIIFIGITISFLFEEWRQSKEEESVSTSIMQSMIVELERNDQFLSDADSMYLDVHNGIQKIINKEEISRSETVDLSFTLLEGISQIRLKEISSFVHGFSSNEQLNILDKNKDILRYLSYIQSLTSEHEIITNSVIEYNLDKLWPVLAQYGFDEEVISTFQEDLLDIKAPSKEGSEDLSLLDDPQFLIHLRWSQMKILRLIQINDAIHRQIKNTIRELNVAIEAEV